MATQCEARMMRRRLAMSFPHPSPLPGGEGAKGASLIASSLILTPMLPGEEEAYPGTCAPAGEKGAI
jgi:hypothetical protein